MGMIMKNGVPYASGSEIPEGGTKGQVLAKASNISGDFEWVNGGDGGGNATFDVATIPQGPTSAHEINAVVSNADNENVRLSYVRQSDGTLPNAINLGVLSGLGDDSFELPTKAYVNSKALSPTGWGVARTGVATVTFNNNRWSTSATVDVSDLGFSSGADYDVVAQPTTGGTATPWGNAIAFVNADKGASSFSVSSVTMEENLSGTVNVKYTIFAKGYGAVAYTGEIPTGGTTGQVLTKRSDAEGDYGWETGGGSGTVDDAMSDTSENAVQNKAIKAYVDNIQGLPSGGANGQILARNSMSPDNSEWIDNPVGDLESLTTTDKTSAVGAINELDFAVKGLGEPFRVKQWGSNTLNVEIPYCTEDIANGSIPKMVYSIDDVEGADYQIVGMIAYEVFDAASSGNRINCWPVCQFTGNGQKELSVRWACMGTTRKTAKRINAWVLLKHR